MFVRPATLAALLFAVLALAFAACGDDEPSSQSGAASNAAQEASGEQEGESEGEEAEEGESEEEREREEAEAREAAGKPCSEVDDLDGEPANQPPADVKILDGAHVYESEGPFGKTERFYAAIDGGPDELPAKRDAAAKALEDAGFKTLSTDEEEEAEAEAHLQGDEHTVDIQVVALCEGKLRIRYTVS